MAQNNVNITRLQGGLARRVLNTDGTVGIITTGVAVVGGLTLGEIYPLKSVADLEALGVDAAYDTTNKTLIHHHLTRLFFRNPSATVYLMVLAQTVTLTQMVDVANTSNAKKLLKDTGKRMILGVIRNPASGYTPTLTGGLDGDVLTAIPKAQELIDEEDTEYRYHVAVVEGRSFNGTAAASTDLRTLDSDGVAVVVAADNDISGVDALYNGYAAVGDFLGMLSKAAVSQNPAEVIDAFNLTSAAKGYFINPGLSSNALITTYNKASLDTLHDKGYIFASNPGGISGCWFNDSHTCTSIASDYAYLENNRTINKAMELVRTALLPYLNARLRVDENTGYLQDADRLGLEETAKNALEGMLTDGDISGGIDCFIEPEQNLLSSSTLAIKVTFIPVAIGRQIEVSIGFTNPF